MTKVPQSSGGILGVGLGLRFTFAADMESAKSVIQSVYVLGLLVGGAILIPGVLGDGENIYSVAALLVVLIAGFFFSVHWWKGWKQMSAARLIVTACLGAGTLIVAGQWFTDQEPNAVPLWVAGFVLVGWMFWNQVFNQLPQASMPASVPSHWNTSGKPHHVVLLGLHPKDPSMRMQVAAFSSSSLASVTSVVCAQEVLTSELETIVDSEGLASLELTLKPALPFLVGGNDAGSVPGILVIDQQGKVEYGLLAKDKRKLTSPEFVTRILTALASGQPLAGQ